MSSQPKTGTVYAASHRSAIELPSYKNNVHCKWTEHLSDMINLSNSIGHYFDSRAILLLGGHGASTQLGYANLSTAFKAVSR